jgi:hypothetical protein
MPETMEINYPPCSIPVSNACGGEEIACNDDYCDAQSQVVADLVLGKTYYIRVAGFNGATGNYKLLVTNGACTGPIESDLNNDCRVNFSDFAIFASEWLDCNFDPPEVCWE